MAYNPAAPEEGAEQITCERAPERDKINMIAFVCQGVTW